MSAPTHDKRCLPRAHPVKLKGNVYHPKIIVNTKAIGNFISTHPYLHLVLSSISVLWIFCFLEVMISMTWACYSFWFSFSFPFTILHFSGHLPSSGDLIFIQKLFFHLPWKIFLLSPSFFLLPPLFLSFDLFLEGTCQSQMVLDNFYVILFTVFYMFSFVLGFL